MDRINHRIVLARRPRGEASAEDFRMEQAPVASPGEGEVLVRNAFLSLDPYMRGRMDDTKSYAPPQPLDAVMVGTTVGTVVESRHPGFAAGDKVLGPFGWQEYGLGDGRGLRKLDDARIPLSWYLGAAGMPGVTAWYGLNEICRPKSGETLVVSAASGAVGSVVGQLGRRLGCRVIGVAGGAEKCDYVTGTLGFDACLDHRAGDIAAALRAAAPDGVDAYFDNVGGAVLDAVLGRMNAFGRIAVCGMIAGYDGAAPPLRNAMAILIARLTVRGFIVGEHRASWPRAMAELAELAAIGALQNRETIAEGLASAPEAFLGLLKGRNFGKQLVRLGPA